MLASDEQRQMLVRLFAETNEEIMRVVTEYVEYVENKLGKALDSSSHTTPSKGNCSVTN